MAGSPFQPQPAHQPGTGKGEEKPRTQGREPGRFAIGMRGARRRTGKSTPRDATGVAPGKGPIDPQSPYLPPP